jgi:hypothetical protein
MNQEIKKRWVEALRSGEYEQGRKHLHPEAGKYCCLGVLCDLHSKDNGVEWESGPVFAASSYMGSVWKLPLSVMAWADLAERDPLVNGLALSIHNDGRSGGGLTDFVGPKSFQEIAQLIEEEHL